MSQSKFNNHKIARHADGRPLAGFRASRLDSLLKNFRGAN